jgi:hypothetical protein
VVRGGDAARGGGARAAPAALPPVDGAPRPETIHWDGGGLAGGRDLGPLRALYGRPRHRREAEMATGRAGGRQVVEGSGGEYARDSGRVFSFCLLAVCPLVFPHFQQLGVFQIN